MSVPFKRGPVPAGAIKYFRAKKLKPSFDYRDVHGEEHAIHATVAKATSMDILDTIVLELDRALAEGRTYRDFAKDLTPTLQKLGWWGKQQVKDPVTGETIEAQLGSPRRLKTIYQTNMRTAYAAGQWSRIERTKKTMPYLLYQLGPSREHRPEHKSWHNLLLPVDHPFWQTHMPTNGYGCKCHVRQVSKYEAEQLQAKGAPGPDRTQKTDPGTGLPIGHIDAPLSPVQTEAPKIDYQDWTNRRTGEVEQIPAGIDPGFAHNPGQVARREHMARVFVNKLPGTRAEIGAEAMAQSINFLLPELLADHKRWVNGLLEQGQRPGNEIRVVGALSPVLVKRLTERGHAPSTAAITVLDKDIAHLGRDSKKAGNRALALEDIERLPEIIGKPQAVLWDKTNPALIYAYDPAGDDRHGKVIVRVNYGVKVRDGDGKRQEIQTNKVTTGGLVPLESLRNAGLFELIWGAL